MKNIIVSLTAVSALFLNANAESYVLAKKDFMPPVGTVYETSDVMNLAGGKMQMNMQGQLMDGTMGISESSSEKVEFLAADKIRYTLVGGASEQKVTMMGQAMPAQKTEKSIMNKPLILTKKGDVWSGALEKGEATAKEKMEIEGVAEKVSKKSDFKIYGDKERKVGDVWEVNGADVMGFDGMEGNVKVKFIKVEKFQGVDCAVLECTLDVKGDAPDADMKGMMVGISGTVTLHRSLKDFVDLNADFKGTMKMDGKMSPQPGMEIGMKMNGNMTMKSMVKVSRP